MDDDERCIVTTVLKEVTIQDLVYLIMTFIPRVVNINDIDTTKFQVGQCNMFNENVNFFDHSVTKVPSDHSVTKVPGDHSVTKVPKVYFAEVFYDYHPSQTFEINNVKTFSPEFDYHLPYDYDHSYRGGFHRKSDIHITLSDSQLLLVKIKIDNVLSNLTRNNKTFHKLYKHSLPEEELAEVNVWKCLFSGIGKQGQLIDINDTSNREPSFIVLNFDHMKINDERKTRDVNDDGKVKSDAVIIVNKQGNHVDWRTIQFDSILSRVQFKITKLFWVHDCIRLHASICKIVV